MEKLSKSNFQSWMCTFSLNQKKAANRSGPLYWLLPVLVLLFGTPVYLEAQNIPQAPLYNQLYGNTGVNVGLNNAITTIAPLQPDNWLVCLTSNGTYSNAIVINPPNVPTNSCIALSGNNPGLNSWITVPSLTLGTPGMYGPGTNLSNVTDIWFKRSFFLPANTIFQADWAIWGTDWVQDVFVNTSAAWSAPSFTAPNYPLNRFNGVRFRWCKWKFNDWNEVIIHIRTNPTIFNACKVAAMKVEAFGWLNYLTVSGPTFVCPNTINTYSVPPSPTTGYSWTPIPSWSGSSGSYSVNMLSGTGSGTMAVAIYSVSGTNTTCVAIGGYSVTVPAPLLVTTATTICYGKPAMLTANGASTYTWIAPGPATVSTVQNPTLFPTINTTYTVIGTTAQGCTLSAVVPVTVLPAPNVMITASTLTACWGQPLILTASGTAVGAYTWTAPGLNTTQNPCTVSPTVATTYSASGAGANGCVFTRTVGIAVIPVPTLAVSASPSLICAGSSSTLNVSGAVAYTWTPFGSTLTSMVVTPGVNSVYSVTGMGSNGCTRTSTLAVNVLTVPVVMATPQVSCTGITNTLSVNGIGVASYTWFASYPFNTSGPPNFTVANTPTMLAIGGVSAYTVCGSGSNGCQLCSNMWLNAGQPVNVTLPAALICTSNANCTNLVANSTQPGAQFNWQPGSLTGGTIIVCPTVTTVYSVTATSPAGCPNTVSAPVNVTGNCCIQPTTGLSVLTNVNGTLSGVAYILTNTITVSGQSQLQDVEIWATPDAAIEVLPGTVLDLDHMHIFGCNSMWKGINLQDGGRITSGTYPSRIRTSVIEDALIGINVDNISLANSGPGTPPLEIQRIVFNRNRIGIRISNSDPALTNLPLGIAGCVFTSRDITYSTYPTPIAASSWCSADYAWVGAPLIPGTPPGLRVPSSLTATTGLIVPYLMNGFPFINLKAPYTNQPGHIGIQIENIGDPNGYSPTTGVDINYTYPSYITTNFNLYDGLGTGIDITNASAKLTGGVFQNMQIYPYAPSPTGVFGGKGIAARSMGIMNTQLLLGANTPAQDASNYFWDCITAVDLDHVYKTDISDCIFRSTDNALVAQTPNQPGEYGIRSTTNRFDFNVQKCQFNNLKNGIQFNTDVQAGYRNPQNGSIQPGLYAGALSVTDNYFGPEVASSIGYSAGAPNFSEYFGNAVQLNSQYSANWNNAGVGKVTSNRMDRVFRGLLVNSMQNYPLTVGGNSVYVEDDQTFNVWPNAREVGYGIAVYDDGSGVEVLSNNFEASISAAQNSSVALVYCNNTGGPVIRCNSAYGGKYGYQFDGNNLGTVWDINSMRNNNAGLALTNNGVIGPQGNPSMPSGNGWNPSPIPWSAPAFFQTYCENSDASLSPLYVVPLPNYAPTVNGAGLGGIPYTPGVGLFYSNGPTNALCPSFAPAPAWRTSGSEQALGFQTEVESSGAQVYPNPTSGVLNIKLPQPLSEYQVQLVDINGRQMPLQPTNTQDGFDISALPCGIYLLEIDRAGDKPLRYKIVKTN